MLLLLTTEKTRVPPRLRRGGPLFLRSYGERRGGMSLALDFLLFLVDTYINIRCCNNLVIVDRYYILQEEKDEKIFADACYYFFYDAYYAELR